ncbi:MAG TPA: NAD(P)H-binding protein [Nocardioidaceae bacterium]|nr:NAD(P)H-binding protein [Nocardioidaceae bacterium]
MASPILITGGTGTLGKQVVSRLRQTQRPLRILSRRVHDDSDGVSFVVGDLTSGQGVGAAVNGCDTIVHLAGSAKGDDAKTSTLLQAARSADVRHLVYISVVGADRIPVRTRADWLMFGYFGYKRAAEQRIESSGIGWTTLRATQFHDLILMVARGMAKLPLVPTPTGIRFQPVDTGEVAERLAALTLGEPSGIQPDLGGPRAYELKDLVGSYLRASNKQRPFVPLKVPGGAARAIRAGANLPIDGTLGTRTWEDFLAQHVTS